MNSKSIWPAVSILLFCFLNVSGQNSTLKPGPGIEHSLATWRSAHYRDVAYKLNIRLAPGAGTLKGTEELRVTIDADATPLIIDWRTSNVSGNTHREISSLSVNDNRVDTIPIVSDHIVIPPKLIKRGQNLVSLSFESPISTSGSAVTRYLDREDGSEYIYTLFVPSDASTAFPCIDQPDLKARFSLTASVAESWNIVSNGPVVETTPAKGEKIVRFQETKPISTYLFAFAAGPFNVFEDPSKSIPHIRLFVRKSRTTKAQTELPELFRLENKCLKYLADYFAFEFPFPKYDMVLIPEFAYGGMEHAGATFLREDSILFPSDPTANDFLSRADVMFHETAHQWFGDLVTMRWFDDLWLKEGFAEFMAFKTIDAVMPEYKAWRVFYQRIKPAAYLTDSTKGTTPIYQEISNLSAAKSAYGNIVYRKAPSFLRQAEFFLGPDVFRRSLQSYLKHHAYSNAEWRDLVGEFEKTSGLKLDSWANSWVKTRGMPDIKTRLVVDANNRIEKLSLNESDILGEGGKWQMRVNVLLWYEGKRPDTLTVTIDGKSETEVVGARGKPRPDFIFANADDYGYGRFLLDDSSRRYVLANIGNIHDDFLRSLLWGSLWDSVRAAELAPDEFLDLAIKQVSAEPDEVTVQSLLSRMSTTFNRYLSDRQASRIAPALESLLADQMQHAKSAGLRITWFRAFQAVASTADGRARLKRLLAGTESIPGMTLRSRDRYDLVTSLLARGDEDAVGLLTTLSGRATTDDDRRYAYAAAAAVGKAEVKEKYFTAFLNDPNLAESWIEAGIGPFNSIHQTDLTAQYLSPALDALPTLKRTRKIFFVNDWLSSFIGGQCSPEALQTVNQFLESNTNLDRDLRLKVLESVDGLERCVAIKRKFPGN